MNTIIKPATQPQSSHVNHINHNISHRSLYCLQAAGQQWVCGGADHSLHIFGFKENKFKYIQTLYEKSFGHGDWVTSVNTYSNLILGGSMDGQLSFWKLNPSGKLYIGHKMINLSSTVSHIQCSVKYKSIFVSNYNGSITSIDATNLSINKQ